MSGFHGGRALVAGACLAGCLGTGCSAGGGSDTTGGGATGGAGGHSVSMEGEYTGGSVGTNAGTSSSGGTTTGGSSASGGTGASAGSGGSGGSSGSPGSGGVAPHEVTPCDSLAEPGVWEQITPPNVNLDAFGTGSIALMPSNTATLYVGSDNSGLHKSTDCGATWVKIDTGTLGSDLDTGTLYHLLTDPTDPEVIYLSSLYGKNGFFKSTNGGVDFTQILTPNITMYAPYGGFVGGADMDPNDPQHLLVGWHYQCAAPYNESCYAETTDGGTSWTMHNGEASWTGNEGESFKFLDSDTWLFSSQSNGMWRSTDHGESWEQLPGASVAHGGGQLYRSSKGGYFLGSADGVMHSDDGITWTEFPNSGNLIQGVVGNGTTVWASSMFPYNPGQRPGPHLPYFVATEAAPSDWKTLDSPMLTGGAAQMAYDPDHHLLYSVNCWEGVWRVVVE